MSKAVKIALSIVLGLALIAGAGLWWFFSGDEPDEVSLDAATEQVTADEQDESDDDAEVADDDAAASDDVSEASDDDDAVVEGESSDISGTWPIDADSGEFDYESATGSFVGFRIEEELSGIGSTTAVGRTGDVTGELTFEGTSLTAASFDVDMTTITTEDSRRDDNVQDALETGDFPSASFVLTEAIALGDGATAGEAVSVVAAGDLTIHGVTQSVSIPIEAQLVSDTIVVVGSIDIVFADYGVEVPESQIVVSVEDSGILEFQLLFAR